MATALVKFQMELKPIFHDQYETIQTPILYIGAYIIFENYFILQTVFISQNILVKDIS